MNIDQIKEEMGKYKNRATLYPDYLFRGHSISTWALEPSFTRLAKSKGLNRQQAIQLEAECVNKFSLSARKLIPTYQAIKLEIDKNQNTDYLGWFPVMQHYSAPTRALDWTNSPWVALYFACSENFDKDGSIWIADFKKVTAYGDAIQNKRNILAMITDPNSDDILHFMTAHLPNERIEAQQGRFSVCTNLMANHETEMRKSNSISKFDIGGALKHEILLELDSMNINAKTLFPGIDGLGKSVSHYCNIWTP